MKTFKTLERAAWLAGVVCAAPALAQDAEKSELDYRNWVDFSFGGNIVHGDNAAFQQRNQIKRGIWGGVSDFHWEQDVGKKGLFEVDGRGLFDEHDYSLKLSLEDPDIGYVRAGYREFRNYYDATGGYSPTGRRNYEIFEDARFVDRGEAFFEAGLTLPNKPQIRFRYANQFREGDKDSTIWADTGLTGGAGTKKLVPSLLRLDETRHIFDLDIEHTIKETRAGIGVRAELSDTDNARYMRRFPGQNTGSSVDRFLTQREGVTTDLLNARAWQETKFNDITTFSTGYSFTTLDTDLFGSRIYGADFDAMYDPRFARRQSRDHGFINLGGGSRIAQHVANINFLLTPWDHVAIVPAVRIEAHRQKGLVSVTDTEVNADTPPVLDVDGLRLTEELDILNQRNRSFLDLSESLEARYTGVTNWVFYAKADWLQGEGDLWEREDEVAGPSIFRKTDSKRFTQKYAAGATWYPHRRFNTAFQYYHKIRENEYDHTLDSTTTNPTAPGFGNGDLYPAYIVGQDFKTDDVNIRFTWRVLKNLTAVSRYDFQLSSIRSAMGSLAPIESAEGTAHIFSESITWSPTARLYVQGSGTYTMDELETGAVGRVAGRLQVSRNNYWTADGTVGYALTQKTDVQAQYSFYNANNYDPIGAFSTIPFGSGLEEHTVGGSVIHRFSPRMQLVTRYAFMTSHHDLSGGANDYDAHLLSTTLRFRF